MQDRKHISWHRVMSRVQPRRLSLEPVDSRLVYHGRRLEDARGHLGGLFAADEPIASVFYADMS